MSKPILTAKVGTNADLFPDVLALYAKPADRILDMTYGKGVFWRNVARSTFDLVTNDLHEDADFHEDFRATSHVDESFDMVVLDPPYMRTNNTPGIMASNYQNQTVNLRTHRVKEAHQMTSTHPTTRAASASSWHWPLQPSLLSGC
jgi:hypothetical protein